MSSYFFLKDLQAREKGKHKKGRLLQSLPGEELKMKTLLNSFLKDLDKKNMQRGHRGGRSMQLANSEE